MRSLPGPNARRRASAVLLTAVTLAAVSTSPATAAGFGSRDALGVRPLANGPTLTTRDGRRVVLRGANLAGLIDYAGVHGAVPIATADAAQARALGLTVVRIGVSWSRIQPRPGTTDGGYLAQVEQAARAFTRRGIYVLLDMHQDRFAAKLGQPPYVEADGAPPWAVDAQGASCSPILGQFQGYGQYYNTPCAATAAAALFENRSVAGRPLQQHYADAVAAVTAVGRRLGPGFAGVELYNEPVDPSPTWRPTWASDWLFPFYDRLIARLRGDGYGGPIWFEGFGSATAGLVRDGQLVFAPHIYDGVFDNSLGPKTPSQLANAYRGAGQQARAFGAALVPGEFPGVTGGAWESYRGWQLDLQDRDLTGGIVWVWKQHPTKDYGWGVLGPDGALRRGNRLALDLARPRLVASAPTVRAHRAEADRLTVKTSGRGTVELWTGAATGRAARNGAAPRLTVDGRPPRRNLRIRSVGHRARLPNATVGGRRITLRLPAGRHTIRLR
ncbi:cellulase family glycosylhydrolase [Patulibacter defluvii]|uniref:cellulase family glycosylhydrolase n=1 Tax=Patulibacter defluvii TaxID=3095358 RepID=UPI002A755426|nr:cellulase family glycosylhydrolase [Patulibacter sp. DM4]